MKAINKIWGTALLAILLLSAAPIHSKAQEGEYISDQQFYDDLDPDGTWVSDPQYGNVWIPNAEDGFRPYATRGHWVVTEYGNTWVSDYRWGWATFHYGRWRYDDYYGWEWIPGHEWAPAWVSWRHGGGYYGWAPLQPGISISISIGGGYHVPDNYWVCAPQAYINRPNIYNYYAPPTRAVTIIRNTTVINNTYVYNNTTYVTGPRREEIQRVTRRNVQVYKINNDNRPGTTRVQNNSVNFYRPAVNKAPDARPARVIDGNAYRKQNPNQAIARRGTGGSPAFNHTNAQKLAQVARAPKPDNKIVRVNPVANRPNPVQPGNQQQQPENKVNPGQPANRAGRPDNKQAPGQPDNKAQQPGGVSKQQPNPPGQQQVQQKEQQARQQLKQNKQQLQQQTQQKQQQAQQDAQKRQQQPQQQLQQQAQQKQQQAQQDVQKRQQQAQQNKQQLQQQAQQKQQQAQQQAQQQKQQQVQQQAQQRQQQQAQQQAQQRQQQQAAQQAQQRQQQQRQQQQKKQPPQQEPRKDQ
ncbi:MAG: hypothetical protein M3O71_21690 [Bacteroidota bacterium]|nr:hypothetical protein [Bacteroidota bacterium]